MKQCYTLLFLFISSVQVVNAQSWNQYFDGADTSALKSVFIEPDTGGSNIWQIGRPQKAIFDSAATYPNALVTDTVNFCPRGNTSSFRLHYSNDYRWGILAVRWKQKIDFRQNYDGGIIEFSKDSGLTWQNVFDNPYVYSFYGFDTTNADTLVTGEAAFTGTDTVWRDIWLCFDRSFFGDSVSFRFTFKSDTGATDVETREGWLIDNIRVERTMLHTVNKAGNVEYLKIYPTSTTGRVYIEAEKLNEYHIIEKMSLINMEGRVVQEFGKSPTKFFIDIGHHPAGQYFLKIATNKKTETFRILLNR